MKGKAFPSFRLLYLLDEVISPTITIKVVWHQWYWSYEYSDYVNESGDSIEFDSYMIPEDSLELGQFRLLDVDNKVIVPVDTHIRLIVTGAYHMLSILGQFLLLVLKSMLLLVD